jgi:hypothetical protein
MIPVLFLATNPAATAMVLDKDFRALDVRFLRTTQWNRLEIVSHEYESDIDVFVYSLIQTLGLR